VNINPENIEISVHDEIKVNDDWTASIHRIYQFVNTSQDSGSLELSFTDKFESQYVDFHPVDKAKLAEHSIFSKNEKVETVYWAIRLPVLAPGEKYVVEFEGKIMSFITIENDGVHCLHKFAPELKMLYKADITFPYKHFLDQVEVSVFPHIGVGQDYLTIENNDHLTILQRTCRANILGPVEISIKSKVAEQQIAPMLQFYARKMSNEGVFPEGTTVLIILHFLSDFYSLLRALEIMGLKRENTFLVAIPYSAKEDVVSLLLHCGYSQIWFSRRYGEEFHSKVLEAVNAAVERCKNISGKLVILQDGGYATTLLHKHHRNMAKVCIGAVEQTTNGIWECDAIPKEERIFPIIDVARCRLKSEIEPPFIGDAVTHNIVSLVSKINISIRGRTALVIGYGTIGKCVAKSLKGNGVIVTVYDIESELRNEAKKDGFETNDSLEKLIPGKRFIIGCTGKQGLNAPQIALADNKTIFVNATSKLLEINRNDLKAMTKGSPQLIENYGIRHTLINDNVVDLLAEGVPVNFYGSDSVPNNEIQFVPTLIFLMALKLIREENKLPKDIVPVPEDIQKEIQLFYDRTR
jgi:adenosylhomocysteinase